jgi:glycosidase
MTHSRRTPAWLDTAVFYEIYPQSFYDSNADGIGDLQGIKEKLPYIQSLGCNAIWLNPCFESPFGDAGYDVSDFYKVAPRYGTNEDLYELFAEAHRYGMRVVLDLVAGHTSVEHPWFKASCEATPNKYTNWYIWTSTVWHHAGPHLQQVNGYCERDGNYITNFFHFQPALNYGFAAPDPACPWQLPVNHPDVQAVHQELRNIMAFWLEKGADGFRVDMASSLIKFDKTNKAMVEFWQGVRSWLDESYPEAVLIAEWSLPEIAIRAGFHIDFMLHFGTPAYTELFRSETINDTLEQVPRSGHSFFHRDGEGDIRRFLDPYLTHYEATKRDGYISLPTGNHDISRIRAARTDEELKIAYAFLFTMPGVPFLYQGDEIGMRHIDGLPSKEGGYVRTGARTPIQWNDNPNAGFSAASEHVLYLPIDPDPNRPTIADQEADPSSLLQFTREILGLRARCPALQAGGDFIPVYAEAGAYPFIYMRSAGKQKVVIALNPSGRRVTAVLDYQPNELFGEQILGDDVVILPDGTGVRIEMPETSFALFLVPSEEPMPENAQEPSSVACVESLTEQPG